MRFARWVFTIAPVYGVVVLAPLLFLEPMVVRMTGPLTYPEYYYGFLGVALVFQAVFWLIGRDPVRLRPIMLPAAVGKFAWGAVAWGTWLQGRGHPVTVGFATVDVVLGVLFVAAWVKTPRA